MVLSVYMVTLMDHYRQSSEKRVTTAELLQENFRKKAVIKEKELELKKMNWNCKKENGF